MLVARGWGFGQPFEIRNLAGLGVIWVRFEKRRRGGNVEFLTQSAILVFGGALAVGCWERWGFSGSGGVGECRFLKMRQDAWGWGLAGRPGLGTRGWGLEWRCGLWPSWSSL